MNPPPVKASLLPDVLPLFPLSEAILLPRGRLPLNIFEPRYLAMVEDSLGQGRMIGLVQPAGESGAGPLYQVGCAGRIVSFAETDDGRFLIHLLGVCRFRIGQELPDQRGTKRIRPDWSGFLQDLNPLETDGPFDRDRLLAALRPYFKAQGVTTDWEALSVADGEELISSLAMACELPASERQALLEAPNLKARADLLIALLQMACLRRDDGESARH